MARQPYSVECSVKWSSDLKVAKACLPEGTSTHKRVWTKELAAFLGEPPQAIMRIARKHGWLRCIRPAPKWFKHFYVSEQAAQRIIIFCRSKQGGRCLDGRDYFAERERAKRTRRCGAVARERTEQTDLNK